jgi:hypothetical protein
VTFSNIMRFGVVLTVATALNIIGHEFASCTAHPHNGPDMNRNTDNAQLDGCQYAQYAQYSYLSGCQCAQYAQYS